MKCILVEDEEVVRFKLRALVEAAGLEVIDEAASYREGVAALRNHPECELLFLDVELLDGTGFDLIEALENPPKTIFVTNYEAYALRAFEADAVDYIQKPVTAARLARALRRIDSSSAVPRSTGRLQADDLVVLPISSQKFFTHVREITLIESADNYTNVIRSDGRTFLVKRSMTAWEEQLPSALFKRLGRGLIVNISAMDRIDSNARLCFKNAVEPLVLKRAALERLREFLYSF